MAGDSTKRAHPAGQGPGEQATRGASQLTSRSAGGLFVTPVRLGTVDSTNRYLSDLATGGAPEGTSVLAETQTAGRGRLGRQWLDVAGGSVLCSVLFRPELPIERWQIFGWLVALSARDACEDVAGVEVSCKWPNDLEAGGRKVAGLLAEVVPPSGSERAALVVGVGINCNWPADWPPPAADGSAEIIARATSLDRVAGRRVERDAVAERLLERIAQRHAVLAGSAGGSSSLASEYRRNLATIGRQVRVDLGDETVTGTALDVDDEGRLLVDVGACIRTLAAGDVVHVR